MKKEDWISVLITFGVGFFAGVFLYVTGGVATHDSEVAVPEEQKLSEFTIVGDVYGGCLRNNSCPSFRVLNDGSYRYFHTPSAGVEQVLRTGSLPRDLQKLLRQVVVPVELVRQSQSIEPSFCNSFVDGIDVKYQITLDGAIYDIDSCGTAVADNGVLWTTLGKIWDFFETGGNN